MKAYALPLWLGLMLLCSHPSIAQVTMPINGTAYIGDANYSDFTINDYMVFQASDVGPSVVAECTINLVDFIDGADVRVVQRGRSFGFSLKTTESLLSVGEFVRQELQGGVATELEVFRLVHDTHASAAYLAEDAVMRNGPPHGLEELGH